jgi:predicted RNA-binding protein with PIN domain
MRYLIDGYNLMHAVGYLSPRTPLNRMESSRRRLIDWLATHARSRPADQFHVVFDAKTAPQRSPDAVLQGVTVSFAFGETADDYLERLLAEATELTTLVTNDSAIQSVAKRRAVRGLACSAFVDEMLKPTPPPAQPTTPADEKPAIGQQIEAELLRIFDQPKKKTAPKNVPQPGLTNRPTGGHGK